MATTPQAAARRAHRPRSVRKRPRAPAAEPRPRPRVPAALIVAVVLFGVWEVAVRAAKVPAFVLPPPSAVLRDLAAEPAIVRPGRRPRRWPRPQAGLPWPLPRAVLRCGGSPFPVVRLDFVTPLVVVSQTVPVITLAPLLILWFGYETLPRVVVCALVAFFPMAITYA